MLEFFRSIANSILTWFRSSWDILTLNKHPADGPWHDEEHRQAEEAARLAAEAEARRKVEELERARAADAEERCQAEEAARLAAEAEARRKAEEDELARAAAEAERRRLVEEAARLVAEAPLDGEHVAEIDEQTESAAEEGLTGERGLYVEPPDRPSSHARASRYRAPTGGAPTTRQQPAGNRSKPKGDVNEADRSRALSIELRLLFERGECCRVSLLPKRTSGLPEELTLRTSTGSVDLVALQDDWYQDIVPSNLGELLRDGAVWQDEGTGQEWLLSGREIYVLASGSAHRGLVTCPRLLLGREHAVLCTSKRLPEVITSLQQTSCNDWKQLDENDGVPQGWFVIRGIVPRSTVPLVENSDILNILRPLPQIEINLEGGIPLGYTSWLATHPPSIRVYGDPDHIQRVTINGQDATLSNDGCYTAPGWDEVGDHQIWCNGTSKSY